MLKEKLPFVLINTLLLHIPLLALTHGQNDGQRNEYIRCVWAGGPFFPVVPLCQFFVVVAGNSFNSLTAIDGHDRQYFSGLRSTVVSRRIFIRSQSLIAR